MESDKPPRPPPYVALAGEQKQRCTFESVDINVSSDDGEIRRPTHSLLFLDNASQSIVYDWLHEIDPSGHPAVT